MMKERKMTVAQATELMYQDGRDLKDLEETLGFFEDDFEKSEIAISLVARRDLSDGNWIVKEGTTLDDIDNIFPYIVSDAHREEIVMSLIARFDGDNEKWFAKEGKTLNDIEETFSYLERYSILHYTEEQYCVEEMAVSLVATYDQNSEKWSVKEGKTLDEIKEVLPYIVSDSTMLEIVSSLVTLVAIYDKDSEKWFAKDNKTLDEITEIFPYIKSDSQKEEMIISIVATYDRYSKKWVAKEGKKLDEITEILPYIKSDSPREEIIIPLVATYDEGTRKWSVKEGKTIDEIKKIIPYIGSESIILEIVLSLVARYDEDSRTFSAKDGKTLDEIKELFSYTKSYYYREKIILSLVARYDKDSGKWFAKEGKTLDEIKEIFPYIKSDSQKKEMILSIVAIYDKDSEKWVAKDSKTIDEIKEIFPDIKSYSQKEEIILSMVATYDKDSEKWVAKDSKTIDEIKEIFPYIKSDSQKEEIILSLVAVYNRYWQKWVAKDSKTIDEIKEIFPYIESDSQKEEIILSIVATYAIYSRKWFAKEGKTLDDIKEILPYIKSDSQKEEIILSIVSTYDKDSGKWVAQEGKKLDEIKEILPYIKNGAQKEEIILSIVATYDRFRYKWSVKESKKIDEIKEVFPYIVSYHNLLAIISSLATLVATYDKDKKKWTAKEGKTIDEIKEILPYIKSDSQKEEIILSIVATYDKDSEKWTAKEGKTIDEIKEIFPDIKSDSQKEEIILSIVATYDKDSEKWVAKEGKTLDEIKEIFPDIKSDSQKEEIILSIVATYDVDSSKWFAKEGKTIDEIKEILPYIKNVDSKQEIILSLVKTIDDLKELSQDGFVGEHKYDITRIVDTYIKCKLPTKDFPRFCKELYEDSENAQSEAFQYGIGRIFRGDQDNFKNEALLFIASLEDHKEHSSCLTTLRLWVIVSELDILKVLSNYSNDNFNSFSEQIKSKNALDSLTSDGFEEFKRIFAYNPDDPDPYLQQLTLDKLFFYYLYVSDGIVKFKSVIDPNILQDLKDNFKVSETSPFISKAEFEKISAIVCDTPQDKSNLAISMPKVQYLSDLFIGLEELGNMKLTKFDDENYQIAKSIYLSEGNPEGQEETKGEKDSNTKQKMTRQEATWKLKEFSNNFLSPRELADFFYEIFHLEDKINDREAANLLTFFNRDKDILATLLCQEGGLDNISSTLRTLSHGCFANIGAQIKKATISCLIEDPIYEVLFLVYDEKISNPILLDPKIGVDHPDPELGIKGMFHYNKVNENYISPAGLFKVIEEEFYKNGYKPRQSDDFITNILRTRYVHSEEESQQISQQLQLDIMGEDFACSKEELESEKARIASYLIISNLPAEFLERFSALKDTLDEYQLKVNNAIQEVVPERVASGSPVIRSAQVLDEVSGTSLNL